MNCKPGQMAMVVSGEPSINHGRVVRVIALRNDNLLSLLFGVNFWLYEGELIGFHGGRSEAVDDSCLRPLRDDFEPEDITTDEPVEVVA